MRELYHETFAFKFHWLNDQGTATSTFRKRGSFDGEVLTLEKTEIPAVAVMQSVVHENRIALAVLTEDEEQPVVHLLFRPAKRPVTEALKSRLDIARSRLWAQHHREALRRKGLEHTYRQEVCPVCRATLILSNMPRSPQLYCHFCDSLTTIGPGDPPMKHERVFKICDECGMYSKPRKFTIFYFYFLVVVFGTWSKPTWRCPGCMREEAWKMFFGNLPFLVGLPVAVAQLFRCYGGDVVGGAYKGLDTANLRARKGDLGGALDLYRRILERAPHSAGVKYNFGMALLAQGDKERAANTFELVLEDCANYVPAYHQLKALYEELGETQQLEELEHIWSTAEDDEPQQDATAEAGPVPGA